MFLALLVTRSALASTILQWLIERATNSDSLQNVAMTSLLQGNCGMPFGQALDDSGQESTALVFSDENYLKNVQPNRVPTWLDCVQKSWDGPRGGPSLLGENGDLADNWTEQLGKGCQGLSDSVLSLQQAVHCMPLILQSHVLPVRLLLPQSLDGGIPAYYAVYRSFELNGQRIPVALTITKDSGTSFSAGVLNSALVTLANQTTLNGIIHLVDQMMMPPIAIDESLRALGLKVPDLTEDTVVPRVGPSLVQLSRAERFTLFLPASSLQTGQIPENWARGATVQDVLYVQTGPAGERIQRATSLSNSELVLSVTPQGGARINGRQIIRPNLLTIGGVIHVYQD